MNGNGAISWKEAGEREPDDSLFDNGNPHPSPIGGLGGAVEQALEPSHARGPAPGLPGDFVGTIAIRRASRADERRRIERTWHSLALFFQHG